MNSEQQTIGLIAPAYSLSIIDKRLQRIGFSTLKDLNFIVKTGKNISLQRNYMSGTVEERLSDMNSCLNDPSVNIIMSVIGGYNSNQLLPYLNYELIAQSGKKIIGYSDMTAVLNAIYTKTGIVTYLGPAFISFCNPTLYRETVKYFEQVVVNGEKEVQYTPPKVYATDEWYLKENFGPREEKEHPGWKFLRKGQAEGILVGGNLGTIVSLAGTEFFPDMHNKILILEGNVLEQPAIVHRNLTQLKQMGVFEQISGLIVGKFGDEFYDTADFERILLSYTDSHKVPIVMNITCSHVDPLYSMPIGGQILLDSDKEIILKI